MIRPRRSPADDSASIYRLGAQIVAQYPGWITPFVDLGISVVRQLERERPGSDTDYPIHLGPARGSP